MIKIAFDLLARLPLPLLHGLGTLLGWAVYGLSPSYRLKIEQHARIAFPQDELARIRAIRGSVSHAGMALFELPFLWGRPTMHGAAACTQIKNWEVIEQAQAQGKGVIFLTPHMGSFESTAQVFSTRAPITVLYRPNRKAEIQHIIEASRARNNVALAPTTLAGVKILLKALKRGEAVGMLPDQVPAEGEGVWANMFGQPAYTMTLPGRLQQATGAAIVLAIGVRKPNGEGFILELYPGPERLSADPVQAAGEVNQAMESLIMKHPEQYYWGYERYKPPKSNPRGQL
ncbi:lysophospholipid acyltransferase family protein [Limnobacter sp.]|uniref:lysophospholipid acyltransferase family protein n=1 Tax=Limnobacter sp. TaxID=2003368 RepID=UPI003511D9C5